MGGANETSIVFDTRVAGGLAAHVYGLASARSGRSVEMLGDRPRMHDVLQFWTTTVHQLHELASGRHLVLFGITFLESDRRGCLAAIESLAESFDSLEIWSHRWPDGFSLTDRTVGIPPFDVFAKHGLSLTIAEKQLLRLSAIAARSVPTAGPRAPYVTERDLHQANGISQLIEESPEAAWADLWKDGAEEWLSSITPATTPLPPGDDLGLVVLKEEGFVHIDLGVASVGHEEKALETLVITKDLPTGTVVSALSSDRARLYLYRYDPEKRYPSMRWLVENRAPISVRNLDRVWLGPQDAIHAQASENRDENQSRADLIAAAKDLGRISTGGRYVIAALNRDLVTACRSAVADLDITGFLKTSTAGESALDPDPNALHELHHFSSRTNSPRETIVLSLIARNVNAAEFAYMIRGRNLEKLERLLEGVLLGFRQGGGSWLGLVDIPARLRLDIDLSALTIESFRDRDKPEEVVTLAMSDLPGMIDRKSIIGEALAQWGSERVVVYGLSETIGPSIAHTLVLIAAAEWIKPQRLQNDETGRSVRVLDLFAGSGIANKALSSIGCDVVSVDRATRARDVEIDPITDGLWLRADVYGAVNQEDPLIELKFDLVGLDPPHSILLDIVLGRESDSPLLVDCCAKAPGMLVMYVGHSSQGGRIGLVREAMHAAGYPYCAVITVDEELVVLGSVSAWIASADSWVTCVDRISSRVGTILNELAVERTIRPVEWADLSASDPADSTSDGV